MGLAPLAADWTDLKVATYAVRTYNERNLESWTQTLLIVNHIRSFGDADPITFDDLRKSAREAREEVKTEPDESLLEFHRQAVRAIFPKLTEPSK